MLFEYTFVDFDKGIHNFIMPYTFRGGDTSSI